MTRRPGLALYCYLLVGVLGLAASLAIGHPGPAVAGTPLLLMAALGAVSGPDARAELSIRGLPEKAVEGDTFHLDVEIVAASLGRSVLLLPPGPGLRLTGTDDGRILGQGAIGIGPVRERRLIRMQMEAVRWGRWTLEPPSLRVTGPLGSYEETHHGPAPGTITVAPSPDRLQRLLTPHETNLHAGDIVSRRRGHGTEFADIRPYRPGDDSRSLNWRVSNRLDEMWVNERHPEHNGDVVVLVDAQPVSRQTLDRSVRMAEALLGGHGRRRHRLGLINLGGVCRWVHPGTGEQHRRRLVEELVSVAPGQLLPEAVERSLHRAVRPPAMLVALTPLLDAEMAGMLRRLRVEGVDVVVVEPVVALPSPRGQLSDLGRRLWSLDRDRIRDRLIDAGIPTASWREGDPPDVPLSAIEAWRKAWRRAPV